VTRVNVTGEPKMNAPERSARAVLEERSEHHRGEGRGLLEPDPPVGTEGRLVPHVGLQGDDGCDVATAGLDQCRYPSLQRLA